MCVTQGTLQSSVYCNRHQSYSHAMIASCALMSKVVSRHDCQPSWLVCKTPSYGVDESPLLGLRP
jgi:hypothetical protein